MIKELWQGEGHVVIRLLPPPRDQGIVAIEDVSALGLMHTPFLSDVGYPQVRGNDGDRQA